MTIQYCHPLVRSEGDRYTSPPKEELDGVPLASWQDLKDYLHHRFTVTKGCVEYEGRTFYADVWIPDQSLDDYCYFVGDVCGSVDSDEIPEATSIAPGLRENIQAYARSVWDALRYSEALAPDERSHLPSEYIRPTFTICLPQEIEPDLGKQVSVDEVLSRQRVVVFGSAGAGKTSFARWLAIESAIKAAENPDTAKIPLYVRLASVHPDASLPDALADKADQAGAPWLAHSLFKLAELGRVQFILDGLDEILDTAQERFIDQLRELSVSYPLATMIVTCRPTSYQLITNEFSHFYLRPFGPTQIAEWTFRRLFDKPERSWKVFASSLLSSPDLLHLVSNPLLLNIATHVYARQNTLPGSKAILVQAWLDALLDQWDHVRSVTRSRENWASPRRRFTALCHAAFITCEQGANSFAESDYLHSEASRVDGFDARETLYSLHAHCGVVRQSSDQRWQFLHQVLLEHCAAAYLVEGSDDLVPRFNARISNPLWQNIWLQACALSQDSTDLVKLVLDHRELELPAKVLLLLKSFAQPIRCDNSVLGECIELVYSTLRAQDSRLSVTSASPPSEQVLWIANIFQATKPSKDTLAHLLLLVEALYAARRSPLVHGLLQERRASPFVSVMAGACEIDGELRFRQTNEQSMTIIIENPFRVEQ